MTEPRKTIKGWEKFYGLRVLDPDGFDRSDPALYQRKFTQEAFKKGVFGSTIDAGEMTEEAFREVFGDALARLYFPEGKPVLAVEEE